MSCLSDENRAAFADGSASDEQLSAWHAWHDHIATCDACATRFAMNQVGSTKSGPASVKIVLERPFAGKDSKHRFGLQEVEQHHPVERRLA